MSKAAHNFSCTQSSSRLNVGDVVVNNSGEFAPTTFWRYPRCDVTNSMHIFILVGKVYSTSTCASLCCFPYFGWPMSHLPDGATPQLSSLMDVSGPERRVSTFQCTSTYRTVSPAVSLPQTAPPQNPFLVWDPGSPPCYWQHLLPLCSHLQQS